LEFEMSNNHRRIVLALGALLAPPLLGLLASPLASADPDVTSFTFDGDTLSFNDITLAIDNLYSASGLDLDVFYGSTSNYGLLLTDPGVAQLGYEDIGGVVTYIDNFPPTDFIGVDPGLADIAGGGSVGTDILGLFGL
jgi:hypothetical protein